MASGEKYSRSEKSLSTLTKKFVEMLQSGTSLDLNTVSVLFVFIHIEMIGDAFLRFAGM